MHTVPDGGVLDAVIVQRVSSKDARRERSVDDQEAENRAECEVNGWRVAETYSQQNSASRFARTGGKRKTWAQVWAELTDVIAAGAYGVVVMWESSRGDRTPETWFRFLSACRESGTLIHITTHRRTYDMNVARDWGVLAEDGVDNAKESEKISERSRRGIRMNVATGNPHGDTPYGYERIYNERTKALIEQRPHPEEAPVAREIKQRTAAGHPYRAITRDLNERRVPTRTVTTRAANLAAAYSPLAAEADRDALTRALVRAVWEGWGDTEITAALGRLPETGRPPSAGELLAALPEREPGTRLPPGIRWGHQVVKQIALNPAYIGQRLWRGKHGDGRPHEASWPAIIDEPTHYAAVAVITNPDGDHRSPGRDKYLLSFVGECGHCRKPLQGNGASGILPAYRGPSKGCAVTRVPWLDAYIEELLLFKLMQPGTWERLTAGDDSAVTAARADAEACQAKIEEAADAYSRDRIGIEALERTEKVVRPKLEAALARLARLETSGPLRALVRGGPREELPQRWHGTILPARKLIIRETFDYIRLQPAPPGSPRGVRATLDPARIEWEWAVALR